MSPGRMLFWLGLGVAALGAVLVLAEKAGLRLGRLPLDFRVERENFRFYFPLGTSIVVSLVLTFVVWLFRR